MQYIDTIIKLWDLSDFIFSAIFLIIIFVTALIFHNSKKSRAKEFSYISCLAFYFSFFELIKDHDFDYKTRSIADDLNYISGHLLLYILLGFICVELIHDIVKRALINNNQV